MLRHSTHWLMLCKEGMATEAHELLDVMIQRGMEPNVVTFSLLMDGTDLIGQLD